MKKHTPTPSLALIKDYNRKDGEIPVAVHTEHALKLRVNYRRERKYFRTKFKFTNDDWEQVNQVKPPKRFQEDKNKTDKVLNRAKQIIEDMDAEGNEFTFKRFEILWYQIKPKGTELNNLFQERYNKLKEDRPKTSSQYWLAYSSMKKFNEGNSLRFADVTVDFLKNWEKWMLSGADDDEENKKPRSKTTIGMYARCTRHIFRYAIEKGFIKKEVYPFGAMKYAIPTGKNVKKALEPVEIKMLMNHVPRSDQEWYARDMFLLSFYGNGINFKDLCLLKFSQMDNERIVYQRSKTLRTLKEPLFGSITLTHEVKEIINKWANSDRSPENYILPVLNDRFSRYDKKLKKIVPVGKADMAKRIDDLVDGFIKTTNKYLRRIFGELKIDKKVGTYFARHSYATIMRNDGKSTEFIKGQLLHKSVLTTENYLADFPDAVKKEAANDLVNIVKNAILPKEQAVI